MREEVLKKLEEKRSTGQIGSGLEASVTITTNDPETKKVLNDKRDFLRYLFIVSNVELKDGEAAVLIDKASGSKCSRCWNYSKEVGSHKDHPTLCERCVKNI
jgi:isoleucyl-tRNA synthetase